MKLSSKNLSALSVQLSARGAALDRGHILESLHNAASNAACETLEAEGVDPLEDGESLEDLCDAFTSGFLDSASEKGRKALEVLGRLHDRVSELVEGGVLRDYKERDKAGYQALVDLLRWESLPLLAPGERGKAPAAPAPDYQKLLRGANLAIQWCDVDKGIHAPRFGCTCGVCSVKSEIVAALGGAVPAAPVAVVEVYDPEALAAWVIPADPEDKNEERAEWGGNAIESIIADTRTDRECALGDLLADLAHWADRSCSETGQTFAMAVQNAYMHYSEETGGEGLQFEGLNFCSEEFIAAPAEVE